MGRRSRYCTLCNLSHSLPGSPEIFSPGSHRLTGTLLGSILTGPVVADRRAHFPFGLRRETRLVRTNVPHGVPFSF
jgi:hypothetical protein